MYLVFLGDHSRYNEARSRFPCEVCGKCFAKKYNLTVHMRIHRDDRPFKCNICEKAFHTKGNLIAHTITHVKKVV